MRFEWDEAKNHRNLEKHGLSFDTASRVFDDPYVLYTYDPYPFEERWRVFGVLDGSFLVLVVCTLRPEDSEEVVRIISARAATPREIEHYEASYP